MQRIGAGRRAGEAGGAGKQQAADTGRYLGSCLKTLAAKHRCVGDVRGLGLFWTIEIVYDRDKKTPVRRSTEKYQETIVKDLADFLLREKNIYVPADKFGLWIVPPLIVTRDEIDFIVTAMDEALDRADAWVGKVRR